MIKSLVIVLVLFFSPSLLAAQTTKQQIETQLEEFLTGASIHSTDAHDKFWHPDLTYTSSGGERFGKKAIINALGQNDGAEEQDLPTYTAEEIVVRPLSDDVALLTFKLVSSDKSGKTYYYNSGVFVSGKQGWQAINWQATKIP